jgi:hypothetical protein
MVTTIIVNFVKWMATAQAGSPASVRGLVALFAG